MRIYISASKFFFFLVSFVIPLSCWDDTFSVSDLCFIFGSKVTLCCILFDTGPLTPDQPFHFSSRKLQQLLYGQFPHTIQCQCEKRAKHSCDLVYISYGKRSFLMIHLCQVYIRKVYGFIFHNSVPRQWEEERIEGWILRLKQVNTSVLFFHLSSKWSIHLNIGKNCILGQGNLA